MSQQYTFKSLWHSRESKTIQNDQNDIDYDVNDIDYDVNDNEVNDIDYDVNEIGYVAVSLHRERLFYIIEKKIPWFFFLWNSPMKTEKAEILNISTPDSNLKSQIHSLIFMRIRIGGLDLNRW